MAYFGGRSPDGPHWFLYQTITSLVPKQLGTSFHMALGCRNPVGKRSISMEKGNLEEGGFSKGDKTGHDEGVDAF